MNNNPYQPPKKSMIYYALIALVVLMLLNVFVFPSLMSPRMEDVSYDQLRGRLSI